MFVKVSAVLMGRLEWRNIWQTVLPEPSRLFDSSCRVDEMLDTRAFGREGLPKPTHSFPKWLCVS